MSHKNANSILAATLSLALGCSGIALGTASPSAWQNPQQGLAGQQEKKEQSAEVLPVPLPKGKKLILKDGSDQLVREYERKGDRVRYYSVERSSWEEIPAGLVDWEATNKAEAEEARHKQELVEKIRARQAAERTTAIEVDASIEIAPGVFLPDGEGLYVVEGGVVVPLEQSNTDVKLDKGRLLAQVLVPVPVVPSRHRVQIPGARSPRRIASSQPEFYMRTADARDPNLELVRAQIKGGNREIATISTQITGQRSEQRKSLEILKWPVAKGVYKVTLSKSLEPGEYALTEILPEGMNLYVWDFGLDSAASGSPQSRPAQKVPKPSAPSKQKQ